MRTYSAGPNLVPLDFDPDYLVAVEGRGARAVRRLGSLLRKNTQ